MTHFRWHRAFGNGSRNEAPYGAAALVDHESPGAPGFRGESAVDVQGGAQEL